MEKLQMMQDLPYLAEWQQANCARAESEQVAHHANSTYAELLLSYADILQPS